MTADDGTLTDRMLEFRERAARTNESAAAAGLVQAFRAVSSLDAVPEEAMEGLEAAMVGLEVADDPEIDTGVAGDVVAGLLDVARSDSPARLDDHADAFGAAGDAVRLPVADLPLDPNSAGLDHRAVEASDAPVRVVESDAGSPFRPLALDVDARAARATLDRDAAADDVLAVYEATRLEGLPEAAREAVRPAAVAAALADEVDFDPTYGLELEAVTTELVEAVEDPAADAEAVYERTAATIERVPDEVTVTASALPLDAFRGVLDRDRDGAYDADRSRASVAAFGERAGRESPLVRAADLIQGALDLRERDAVADRDRQLAEAVARTVAEDPSTAGEVDVEDVVAVANAANPDLVGEGDLDEALPAVADAVGVTAVDVAESTLDGESAGGDGEARDPSDRR